MLLGALLGALPLHATHYHHDHHRGDLHHDLQTRWVASANAEGSASSPPYYPSPWGSGSGEWADAYEKARKFVTQLTLVEKVNLTTGIGWQNGRCVGETGSIPRLGFRSLCLQDSPVGVRFTDNSSVFPAGVNVAATFDRELAFQRGAGMGAEHRGKGSDMQLGPVVGPLGRAPAGGRNWEGFSPDPVLTGIMAAESIKGIQSSGVIACVKHLIANEQEHFRQPLEALLTLNFISDSLSSNLDDKTMHELYLWPFADAVRAGVGSVMCAYNQVNNSYACQNSYLLNHLLKSELNFQGFVVSDWYASHSGVSAALAGLDMMMPGDTSYNSGDSYWGSALTTSVLNGSIPTWRLDDMATRIVAAWYLTYGYEHYFSQQGYAKVNEHVNVQSNHGELIRNISSASVVLLKNQNSALPLKGDERSIAVFGSDATGLPKGPNACADRGCDDATLGVGWGSGSANFPYLVTPDAAIRQRVNQLEKNTTYSASTSNTVSESMLKLAADATVAIVFVNADSGEAYINVDGNQGDRNDLTFFKKGDALVQAVSKVCNNTILVVHSVGPVILTQYAIQPNISAILWAGLPGQESGNSIVDVLYGDINPGAKIPFTLARNRSDYSADVLYKPNNKGSAPQVNFTEGNLIDYRWFDQHNITPVYEFGYGLTYTTFDFSNLQIQRVNISEYTPAGGSTSAAPASSILSTQASECQFPASFEKIKSYIYPFLPSQDDSISEDPFAMNPTDWIPLNAQNSAPQPIPPAGGAPGGNPSLFDVVFHVQATVKNTGDVAGDEVAQMYVSLGGPNNPPKVLRGFERLRILPGESKTFDADITRRDISNWDSAKQDWVVSPFPKTVYVGSSSRKLPLSAQL